MNKQEVIPLAGLPPVCLGFGDIVLLLGICTSLSDIRIESDNPNANALLVVRYPHRIGQPER